MYSKSVTSSFSAFVQGPILNLISDNNGFHFRVILWYIDTQAPWNREAFRKSQSRAPEKLEGYITGSSKAHLEEGIL